ncbi:MAG TPA: hypothetical protein VML94_01710 [Thermoplasmata archaeon]|nr:hypothetical protein [Thermoplasmata archaeon]
MGELGRTSVPPPTPFRELAARLRSDRVHGAREIALAVLNGLDAEVSSWAGRTPAERRRGSRQVAQELDRIQPAMGTLREWARAWQAMSTGPVGATDRSRLRRWIARRRRRLRDEPVAIAGVVRRRLPRRARVLTISRGSTVGAALRSLPTASRPLEVTVLESLPGGEGRRFAAELQRAGVPSRWVPDRARTAAVAASSLVLIGADSVEADGAVIHKIGTRRLAAEAALQGVPVIVVAGGSKWLRAAPRLRRLPSLFDRTPPELISEWWTDRGARRAGRGRTPAAKEMSRSGRETSRSASVRRGKRG